MSKVMKKIMTGIWVCFAFLCIGNLDVYGASVNITVGSVEAAQGETVNVPVTLSSDEVMGVAEVYVSYDNAYLEYNSAGEGAGGAGMVKFVFSEMDETGKGKTFNISFKAKVAGTTEVSIDANTRVLAFNAPDPEQADMQLAITNGQVNITAPVAASSDCNLTALSFAATKSSGDSVSVNFIPTFSPDILEYKAELSADTERLVVSTTLSDDKATTKVTGTRIDPGENKTTIVVVAEDGTQKSYILYTTRLTEEPSSEETPSGEQPTESQAETTSSPEIDRSPIFIESMNKYMIQDYSLISAPEGYEESYSSYNGRTIAVYRGINKPFALVSLANTPEGEGAAFYIINEVDGNLTKLVDVTSGQKIYTIIPTGADYPGPEGYTHTMLEVNGDMVNSWYKGEESEFYVIYAMNYDGQPNLYVYDTVEKTVQRFTQDNKPSGEVEMPQASFGEIEVLQKKYSNLEEKYNTDRKHNRMLLIGLGAVCFVLVIICIVLLFKANVLKEDEDETEGASSEEKDSEEGVTEQEGETTPADLSEKQKAEQEPVQEAVVQEPQKAEEQEAEVQEPQKVEEQEAEVQEPQKAEKQEAEVQEPQKMEEQEAEMQNRQESVPSQEMQKSNSKKSKKKNSGKKEITSEDSKKKERESAKNPPEDMSKKAEEQKAAEKILSEGESELKSDVEKIMQGLAFDSESQEEEDLEIEFVDLDDK